MNDRLIDYIRKAIEETDGIIGKANYRRQAAVLIPLLEVDHVVHLLYQVRSAHIRQGGEIGFPGGMIEDIDQSDTLNTAIRETCEELGIDDTEITDVHKMGTLLHHTGLLLDIYVGQVHACVKKMPLSEEVASVFLVPIDWLLKQQPRIVEMDMALTPKFFQMDGQEVSVTELGLPERYKRGWSNIKRKLYFYDYKEYMIWGLTGEITYDFIEKIR